MAKFNMDPTTIIRSMATCLLIGLTILLLSNIVLCYPETYELKYNGEIGPKVINNNAKSLFMNKSQYERNNMEPPSLASQTTTYLASEFLAIIYPPMKRSLSDHLEPIVADCSEDGLQCELLHGNYVVNNSLWFTIKVVFKEMSYQIWETKSHRQTLRIYASRNQHRRQHRSNRVFPRRCR